MTAGDRDAEARVFELLREEMHELARHFMFQQGAGHTLQATGLIHEAYLRMHGHLQQPWTGRKHLLGMLAKVMRTVLIDHARGKHRLKRMPKGKKLTLVGAVVMDQSSDVIDPVELEEGLQVLEKLDPVAARIVEYRFYCGLSVGEVASCIDMPLRTVERKWRMARAHLERYLS